MEAGGAAGARQGGGADAGQGKRRGLRLLDGVPILGAACRALPWALNPRRDHFIVAVGLKPEEVLVVGPAHGFAALSWRAPSLNWDLVAKVVAVEFVHCCQILSMPLAYAWRDMDDPGPQMASFESTHPGWFKRPLGTLLSLV